MVDLTPATKSPWYTLVQHKRLVLSRSAGAVAFESKRSDSSTALLACAVGMDCVLCLNLSLSTQYTCEVTDAIFNSNATIFILEDVASAVPKEKSS